MNAISACHSCEHLSIQLCQCALLRVGFKCKECALIKLIGLLLTTVASQNTIHSALVLAEKGTFWASTLSHKLLPRKQTTESKLLILVSFFSGEVTSYTDTSYCILNTVGSMPFRFFWATLYTCMYLYSLQMCETY